MTKAFHKSVAECPATEELKNHPSCPGGCTRNGYRVYETYSGRLSDMEGTLRIRMDIRVSTRDHGSADLNCESSLQQRESKEIECANYLEQALLRWMEQQVVVPNQTRFEAHGSISTSLLEGCGDAKEEEMAEEFIIDFDIVADQLETALDHETKCERRRECYMDMIHSIHRKVLVAQQYHRQTKYHN